MKTPIKLSFVVPAYNEETYLARTLQAIISETTRSHCEAEIVVVNNASTDRTRDVAESFAGVRVVDEPVKSLVRARSAGFQVVTGTLVANIDADTVLPEGWIKTVLCAFSEDPDLVAISGPYIYYDVPTYINVLVRIFYGAGFVAYLISRYVLRVGSMLQGATPSRSETR